MPRPKGRVQKRNTLSVKGNTKAHGRFRALIFLLRDSLVCKALVAGLEVDDAAVFEAALQKSALHRCVVAMGIDAEITTYRGAIIHAEVHNSTSLLCHGDAMNNAVGRI